MVLKTNFENAVRKPFTDLTNLLIGAVLSIFPILNWFAKGFIIECSGLGKHKDLARMPEWEGDFGGYFFRGFLAKLIALIYMIPGIAVLIIGLWPSITSFLKIPEWRNVVELAPMLSAGAILLILGIYVKPMAVLSYLKSGRFLEAFSLRKVFGKAFSINYFIVWVAVLVVFFVLVTVLLWIPVIGVGAALFISGVIGYSLFGEVYGKA